MLGCLLAFFAKALFRFNSKNFYKDKKPPKADLLSPSLKERWAFCLFELAIQLKAALERLVKRCNALRPACLTALLFVPPLRSLCKHCFSALAAVLLLLLPCPIYLSLRDAHLARLRPFLAPLSKPFSDHLILLLYKHPGWWRVYYYILKVI
jgi:hypothetical protein